MKKLRSALGFLLAAIMLLACASGAFAMPNEAPQASAEPVKQTAQDDTEPLKGEVVMPEANKGDVYNGPIEDVTLTEAANPFEALEPVGVIDTGEWVVAMDDYGPGRYVASASIDESAGTHARAMTLETIHVPAYGSCYIGFNAFVHKAEGQTLSIYCYDMDNNEDWEPGLGTVRNDAWYEYSFPISQNYSGFDYTQEHNIRVEIVYTYNGTGSKGGDIGSCCYVTDLRVNMLDDIDAALNAPDSDLHFTFPQDNTKQAFDSCAYYNVNRHFVKMSGVSNGRFVNGVVTHVVAARGDVLSYELVSSLDYMNGTCFYFGFGTSAQDMQVIEYGDESGNGSLWYNWTRFEYTFPANGEYDLIWVLTGEDDSSSYAYLDNVRITPRMTKERVLYEESLPSEATYSDADDTPWYPVYYQEEFCLRSGKIGNSKTSTFITEHNMLKSEDWIEFRLWMSSEQNYDWLHIYLLNEITGVETELDSFSGIDDGWIAYGIKVGENGIFTVKFVYQKDSSNAEGDDCAYLDFVCIPPMTATHAGAYDEDTEAMIDVYPHVYELLQNKYTFVPGIYNGEIVLMSNNQGVPNSLASAEIDITETLQPGDTIEFDYMKDGEANYEEFDINLLGSPSGDGVLISTKERFTEWLHFKYVMPEEGHYSFGVDYEKDGSVNVGTDTAYVRNIKITRDRLNEAALEEYYGFDRLHHVTEGTAGCFGVTEIDGRFCASYEWGYTGAFEVFEYLNGFEYVAFDYKLQAGTALTLQENGTDIASFTYQDDEWHTYYYRIPVSGTHRYRWVADTGTTGNAVYVDNVHLGSYMSEMTSNEILNQFTTDELPVEYVYTGDNFFTCHDPLGFSGYNDYLVSCAEAGETDSLTFNIELQPRDVLYLAFCFRDEDGEPNDSWFEIFANGESLGVVSDSAVVSNRWYLVSVPNYYTCDNCEVNIVYESNAQAGGDGFCVLWAYGDPIGVTLDEALNVEGGTIHFSDPNGRGTFMPAVDSESGRAYAEAYPAVVPDSSGIFDYNWGFESEDELDDWILLDSDGDGYGWHYLNADDDPVSYEAEYGTGVLCSDSYLAQNGGFALDPDNWALSPEIALSEDPGYVNFSFMFAGCNDSWYQEHFGVYVGTGTDISNYVPVLDWTVQDQGWTSFALDLNAFAGQTVRIAFRHYDSYDVYRLMIDCLHVWNDRVVQAKTSFELDVHEGDVITFEAACMGYDPDTCQDVFLELYTLEHPDDVYTVYASQLYNDHGNDEWVTFTWMLPYTGHLTFVFKEYCLYDADRINSLCIRLDNVELHCVHTHALPGDVDLDGRVTYSDISLLYMYLLGLADLSPEASANADFNGDGAVNYVDISDMYMYLLS